MYTVMISDDGTFTAEYVQPPALSIPLGISGSAVEVRRNEDLTFSAMIDGEWMVITAETTVTAANGNVYAAVLSPDGIPIGVMHVAAMQEVMLGALGGTVTVKQAEDMTWWIGEMEVKDGTVYTAANGNMYQLMMDAEGMWSAMYQKVMVMVELGTQGPITLVRAEDMSWWFGSEAVGVGSEVMSDNGNTYTLWYTDGIWSARFEPESMLIEGTGLVAMTREADDMYDVGDSTLPASGMGDVMDGDAMYHVWMQDDGTLAGARFAAAIEADLDTRRAVGDLGDKGLHEEAVVFDLSADDAETPENELRTHLVVDGESFSVADLLGSGMASTMGKNFVAEALKAIQDIRADVDTLLALDLQDTALDPALDRQWGKVTTELNKIFGGTNGDAYTGGLSAGTGAAGTKNPGEDDILEEIDDIIDALSSADAFTAATAKDGKGVFDDAELSSDDAAAAYARTMSAATATLGVSGSTRYGTVRKTATDDAVTKLKYAPMDDNDTPGDDTDDTARIGQQGAFSYSTLQETLRTRHIVSTGNAYYTGGTHAISGDGTVYMGTMDVQVRFTSMTVSGLVSNLESAEGMPWEYRYGDVETIRLPEARLSSNARWAAAPDGMAQATFEARAGSPVPQNISGGATFNGILLGRDAASGSEANGTWSVGAKSAKSDYLAGAFGVIRGEDVAPSLPGSDDGSGTETSVVSMIGDPATAIGGASIEDGMLKLKVKEYDYTITARTDDSLLDISTFPTWEIQTTPDPDGGTPTQNTVNLNIGLAGLLSSGTGTFNSAKHVDAQVEVITKQRDQLAALQGLGTRIDASEREAWQKVQEAIFRVLGSVPPKLNRAYADVKDEAVDLIDDALAAFASNDALDAALDPNGSGIFKGVTNNVDSKVTVGGGGARTPAQIRGARQFQVRSKLGSTSYTRFGVWRLSRLRNAVRSGRAGGAEENRTRTHDSGADGPGMFAYSQLDPTVIASVQDPSYQSGSARYVGETVALQNTTYLTGEVDATVSWDAATVGGTLNVTFTNLANDNGDMLAFGTAATRDADGVITAAANYNVIRDVVFNNIDVGTNADNELIFDNEDIGTRTAGTFGIRYRFTDASVADDTSGAGLIEGKFVGATVDGPLGLFGVWELNANASLGRVNDVGNDIVDLSQAIYGAFGAEAP